MAKLCCVDYGFECAFAAESDNASEMIERFAKHTSDQHGIEYSKEVLMQFMLRKDSSVSDNAYMQTA
jgi:predicted small metal-binding protein